MRKPFTILLFLFALLVCLATSSDVATQPPLDYQEGGVDSIVLEKESIDYCPWSISKHGACSRETSVEIVASSKIAEKERLTYYYLVSGGKIIGKGSKVVWDFTGARPGKYSITVGVGRDSNIKGKTITKTFLFKDCPDCDGGCVCPSLSVTGPTTPTKAGENMVFTANVSGGSQDTVTYKWTVSEGKIAEGQGTSQILVKTTSEMKGRLITATVEIGGINGLCYGGECQNNASASGEVTNK